VTSLNGTLRDLVPEKDGIIAFVNQRHAYRHSDIPRLRKFDV
jgi:hypothetical protein